MKFLAPFVSLMLTPLVAFLPLQAEMPGGAAAAAAVAAGTSTPKLPSNALQIRLADAANAVVEANSTQTGYSIVVTDSAGLPVTDAAVAMRLPEDGPTGFFMNGVHSAVSYTNAEGLAKFAQVNWGPTLGVATLMVTVVKGDLHAGALLEETIVLHLAGGKPARTVTVVPHEKGAGTSPTEVAALATPTPVAGRPAPGTPASVAEVRTGAGVEKTMPLATTTATAETPEPVVSVVNGPATTGGARSSSNKKWLVLALVAVAAGVGAGVALGLSGKAATAAAGSTTGVSIGNPSVSVGH